MDNNLQKQLVFIENLNKLLKEIQQKKPFNYNVVFGKNSEFRKHNTLLQLKLKALLMEEKYAIFLWDVIHNIIQKDIGKVYRKYERNERLYRQMISQMDKFMPSFEYEPLVLSPQPETSNEEKDRGFTNGARPSNTRVVEEP